MNAFEDFEEDPRYAVATREMWTALAYWAGFTVLVTGSAWLIGGNVPASDLTFVLGFPAWFFWSVIVSGLVGSVIPFFLVKYRFTDMPLSADGREE